jgi:DNA-binding NtrC family response regulator
MIRWCNRCSSRPSIAWAGGLDVLSAGVGLQTDAQFVMMSGHGMIADAVDAIRLGAYDYVPKPLHLEELTLLLRPALDQRDRRRALVGESLLMQRVQELILRVAPTRTSVLVTGETGTGKELVAREIHRLSERSSRPFVPVHCAALPESLMESELFGHVKGSFTGATASRRGLLEEAAWCRWISASSWPPMLIWRPKCRPAASVTTCSTGSTCFLSRSPRSGTGGRTFRDWRRIT